mmetsp:Transcript_54436/g.65611  ORF Transcript_54436/g.65611 Transcript_54436/m.65611 type:complete len:210 (+) Transcript_54436:1089-1718(+)
MMVRNLPFSILKYINVGITTLHLLTSRSKRKFINTTVLSPVVPNNNITLKYFTLRLFLQETCKIVHNTVVICTGYIGHGGKKNAVLGITIGNLPRIKGSKSIIPQIEQTFHFVFSDAGSKSYTFRKNRRVVVIDLPSTILVRVHIRVPSSHFGPVNSHSELVNACITGPSITNLDISLNNFSLGLLQQKCIKVILHAIKIGTRSVRHGR